MEPLKTHNLLGCSLHFPNKQKLPSSVPGEDTDPFGFALGSLSIVKIYQIKQAELP